MLNFRDWLRIDGMAFAAQGIAGGAAIGLLMHYWAGLPETPVFIAAVSTPVLYIAAMRGWYVHLSRTGSID